MSFLAEKVLKSVCSCMRSQCPSARSGCIHGPWHAAFSGGGGDNKLVKLVPGVQNAVKVGFLNFTSCFAFRGPINGRVRLHFSAWVHI